MADASLGFFFFFIFFPPKKWGKKRMKVALRLPSSDVITTWKKKSAGRGEGKGERATPEKNQGKKCPSYVVLKQNQKKKIDLKKLNIYGCLSF